MGIPTDLHYNRCYILEIKAGEKGTPEYDNIMQKLKSNTYKHQNTDLDVSDLATAIRLQEAEQNESIDDWPGETAQERQKHIQYLQE